MLIKKIQREHKLQMVENIQQYFQKNTDYEMGNIEAEELLDLVLEEMAPIIYNQAIQDARKVMQKQIASLEEELYVLEVPFRRSK